jgi:signal transduction histidine kinase/DNA-binding response OmpR family regulator
MNHELPRNGNKILVIDDIPANLEMIGSYLEDAGYEVMAAQDGKKGIEIAARTRPELILLDILMPGIDGFETCRRLKQHPSTGDIPVIFLTSLTERELKITGFEAGGVDYIAKPVQIDEVLARVKIHVSLQTMKQRLTEQNVQLQREIEERQRAEAQLRETQAHLERRVEERTAELAEANVSLKDEIKEREKAEASLRERNRELTLFNRVIAASVAETTPETVLTVVCHELVQALGMTRGTAVLLNDMKTEEVFTAEWVTSDEPSLVGQSLPLEEGTFGNHFLTHATPLVCEDPLNHPLVRQRRELIQRFQIATLLAVPLIFQQETLGFLCLGSTEARHLTEKQIDLAVSVANQVSGVLARIKGDQERWKLEAQYYQAQKMEAIGRLTGGIAHDFNNLLTVITGYSDLLLIQLEANSPLRQGVIQIEAATGRATNLVRQLLAFSRKQILKPEILNLNTVIANLERMLGPLVGEDIDIMTVLTPELGPVKADVGQIEQVVMNLVVNARDAMPEGGKLTIETANVTLDQSYTRRHAGASTGPHVMIAVSDTGVGMDAETQAQCFDPFFTTKGRGKGTGLGLATVHGIVNQSGGQVWVYSEPGQGTTFKVYLPRVEERSDVKAPAAEAVKPGRGWETVLVVEDEEALRKLVEKILTDDGYAVLLANDAQKALRLCEARKETIHLLLSDVIIPGGMNGKQLAKELTAMRKEMKVLFMSGYTDNAIVHSGVLDQGIHFLAKPFSPDDLRLKVRQVLNAPVS